jgi:hypothetical protein
MTQSFQPQYGPGVESASNRCEYQEYFLGGKGGRCVGLTALPPSCADCLNIWEPQIPGALRFCRGMYRDCFTFTFTSDWQIEGVIPYYFLSVSLTNSQDCKYLHDTHRTYLPASIVFFVYLLASHTNNQTYANMSQKMLYWF